MIIPSEHSDNNLASSIDLIPKPANVGTEAYFFISCTLLLISRTSKFDAPVTPLRVT